MLQECVPETTNQNYRNKRKTGNNELTDISESNKTMIIMMNLLLLKTEKKTKKIMEKAF